LSGIFATASEKKLNKGERKERYDLRKLRKVIVKNGEKTKIQEKNELINETKRPKEEIRNDQLERKLPLEKLRQTEGK